MKPDMLALIAAAPDLLEALKNLAARVTWELGEDCSPTLTQLLIGLVLMLLTGCALSEPIPSTPGEAVPTPYQCQEVIKRGGRC